jgi:hypothetical protein
MIMATFDTPVTVKNITATMATADMALAAGAMSDAELLLGKIINSGRLSAALREEALGVRKALRIRRTDIGHSRDTMRAEVEESKLQTATDEELLSTVAY